MIVTLSLMAVGTLSIALTPGYDRIGLIAPVLVLAGRLVQGFSAGCELGGVSVYLAEIATPGHRGFYCSFQSASQQVAVVFASLLGVVLNSIIPAEQMAAWGWRIPLLIGCLIAPLILYLRSSLKETEEFQSRRHHPSASEALRIIGRNWAVVVEGVMLSSLTTTTFYLITAYTPTFANQVLHLAPRDSLIVTLCVGFSNLFWLPVGGAISDRVGRRPMLIALPVAAILTAYPAMSWLVSDMSFGNLLIVQLWLSFIFGTYNGAMIPFLAEIMPPQVRTLACVRLRHGALRRHDAGGVHVPDPRDRQPGHAGRLADGASFACAPLGAAGPCADARRAGRRWRACVGRRIHPIGAGRTRCDAM